MTFDTFKLFGLEKDVGHFEQKWGFSFVCVAMCLCNWCTDLKALMQNTQGNGRSSEWTTECFVRSPWDLKRALQTWHWNGLSPVCTRKWFSRLFCEWKALWHTEQAHLFCRLALELAFISNWIWLQSILRRMQYVPSNKVRMCTERRMFWTELYCNHNWCSQLLLNWRRGGSLSKTEFLVHIISCKNFSLWILRQKSNEYYVGIL